MKLFPSITVLLIFFLSLTALAAPTRKASLVIDTNNGKILHSRNAHDLRYPASLVKMMTLYLAFDQLSNGKLSLDKKIKISSKAASMPRTNLGLRAGSLIPVRKAILGLIVHSSNDTAVALAEAIAGSEKKFALMMNKKARKLGMKNTVFYNASGLPHKKQKSTAYDLAKLSMALRKDFPQYFPWFSITNFTFAGKTYYSHNKVLINYKWSTGLKTGFTHASGFNLATTAQKDNKHLVGIVLGEDSSKSRDKLMIQLLDKNFKNPIVKNKAKKKVVKTVDKKTVAKKKVAKPVYKKSADKKKVVKPVDKKTVAKKKVVNPVNKKIAVKKKMAKPVDKKTVAKKKMAKPIDKKSADKKKMAKPVDKKSADKKKVAKPVDKKTADKKKVAKPVYKKSADKKKVAKPVYKKSADKKKVVKPVDKKTVVKKKVVKLVYKKSADKKKMAKPVDKKTVVKKKPIKSIDKKKLLENNTKKSITKDKESNKTKSK